MKTFAFLCQQAVPMPDRTITFIRAPLNLFQHTSSGNNVNATLVVSIRYDGVEMGAHKMKFVGMDQDGREVGLAHESEIDFRVEAGGHMHLHPLSCRLPIGRYQVNIYVDGQLQESLPFEVVKSIISGSPKAGK